MKKSNVSTTVNNEMTAQVKNARFFRGRDGYGMNATLYVNGARVAYLHDAAHGGPINYDVFNKAKFDVFEDAIKKFPPYFVQEMGMEIKLSTDLFISVLHEAQTSGKQLNLIGGDNA